MGDRGEEDSRGAVDSVLNRVDGVGTNTAFTKDRVAAEAGAVEPVLRDVVVVGVDI